VLGDVFGGSVEVTWKDGAEGQARAVHIELLVSGPAIPVAQARDRARSYFPTDVQPVRTYTAPAGQTVEVFRSPILARAYQGTDVFGEAPAGTLIQIAERGSPTTNRVVVAVGDNP
jgi:hypothetical protein